jgi:hypothetical protein
MRAKKKLDIHTMGGRAVLAKYGPEHFKKLGKKTLKKHGKEHFRKMAEKRWGKPATSAAD